MRRALVEMILKAKKVYELERQVEENKEKIQTETQRYESNWEMLMQLYDQCRSRRLDPDPAPKRRRA